MRPHIYSTFAEIVESLAKRSTCSSRAAVGAILFDHDDRIIATGFNGSPRGFPHCDDEGCKLDKDGHCMNAIHAEENALLQCAFIGRSTSGLSIFTTHIPCWRCTLRLIQAGISNIIYIKDYGSMVKETISTCHSYGITINQFHGKVDYK